MKHRLDEKQGESLNGLLEAILSLRDKEECRAFLMDLCTIQELIGMSQRLQVAKLLLKGETYDAIRQSLPQKTSQRKLAEMLQIAGLDIDKNAIQRIESGQRFVTDIELKAIAKVLHVGYEKLLDDESDC